MAYTYEDYKKMYAEKKRTLQECLDMIQSGDHICFGKDCNSASSCTPLPIVWKTLPCSRAVPPTSAFSRMRTWPVTL